MPDIRNKSRLKMKLVRLLLSSLNQLVYTFSSKSDETSGTNLPKIKL